MQTKAEANDRYSFMYKNMHHQILNKGLETIDRKSFDITLVTAFLMYDFPNQCKTGSAFWAQVGSIRDDKNMFISHNPDLNDRLSNSILALSSLKNLKQFVLYLENSDWSGSEKETFIETYKKKLDEAIEAFFSATDDSEKEKIDTGSDIGVYLEGILREHSEHSEQYIPLSYKRIDNLNDQYTLEEMKEQNKRGFVLFADAGYGKTWSLLKLAAGYAEDYLEARSDVIPVFIKMGQIASDSSQVIREYIREKLFQNRIENDDVVSFIRQNKLVLFLDGYDEASSEVKNVVKAELSGLFSDFDQLAVIGGTRESDRFQFPDRLVQYHICDLSELQLEQFVDKFVEPPYRAEAKRALLSPQSFLSKIRTPFYVTCYANFVNEGESDPGSTTDLVSRCLDKMIEREIKIKGFHCTEAYVNEFLFALNSVLGDKNAVLESEALRYIENRTVNMLPEGSGIPEVKDRLAQMRVIREYTAGRRNYLAFYAEQYRTLFSDIGNDDSILDF